MLAAFEHASPRFNGEFYRARSELLRGLPQAWACEGQSGIFASVVRAEVDAWLGLRAGAIGADGEEPLAHVLTINRPDELDDIAILGLTEPHGKRLLAGLQQEIVAAQARSHSV